MGKRFTDTDMWTEDWFIEAPAVFKMFWFYLKDNCNYAGIWRVNIKQFEFITGMKLSVKSFLEYINSDKERIVVLNKEKWYIKSFISFQYGSVLNENNHFHNSILIMLSHYNIDTTEFEVKESSKRGQSEVKVTSRTPPKIKNILDRDKDKDKEGSLRGEKGKEEEKGRRFSPPTVEDVSVYIKEKGYNIDPEQFIYFYKSKDWMVGSNKMKDWKACLVTWNKREKNNGTKNNAGAVGYILPGGRARGDFTTEDYESGEKF